MEDNKTAQSTYPPLEVERADFIKFNMTSDFPIPEPQYCQFCKKMLPQYGTRMQTDPLKVRLWYKEPGKCDCEKAVAYWAEYDAKVQAEKEEQRRRDEQDALRHRIDSMLGKSGMSARRQGVTLDRLIITDDNREIIEDVKRYCEKFMEYLMPPGKMIAPKVAKNGLWFSGEMGAGKSTIAAGIANTLIVDYNIQSIMMTMVDMLAELRDTYDSDNGITDSQLISLYRDVPLLVIDDLGTEKPTEWGLDKLYEIVNYRYENFMPTIVTSNYNVDTIIKRMTIGGDKIKPAKIIDRLQSMTSSMPLKGSWR